jgi:hypothetical protein
MSEQPEHEQIDFVALAAQLTNEQMILGCLQRIEAALNAFMVLYTTAQQNTVSPVEVLAAAKVTGTRVIRK